MKTIEIKGKQYPCRVTMGALLRFKNETGKDVAQMESNDMAELIILLWCCVSSASKADGVEFGMTLMDFADCLDPDTVTGFYTSMEDGASTDSANDDPEKKTGQPTS